MNAVITNLGPSSARSSLKAKKTILVLYSEGGGGHKAAAEAISHFLSTEYDVKTINVLTEIFPAIDFINTFSKGKYSAEDFYNTMLKRGYHGMVSLYAFLGKGYMRMLDRKLKVLFSLYLRNLTQKPDLIISVLPFFNGAMAPISLNEEIPYVLMPTDLDVATFLIGLSHKKIIGNKKFAFAFAYNDTVLTKKILMNLPLKEEQFAITGFPVRAACLKNYSTTEIALAKAHFKFQKDSKILTLVLGASGGENIISYTLAIATSKLAQLVTFELNVCVGRNRDAAKKIINKILSIGGICTLNEESHTIVCMPSGLLIHIRGFVKNFPELMACSDLIISKTGSASVNEAIYLKKTLLLDDTPSSSSRKLKWESVNVPFVKRHKLGDAFRNTQELKDKIAALLFGEAKNKEENTLSLPDFKANLLKLVHKMVST